jgi:hypothetical protein
MNERASSRWKTGDSFVLGIVTAMVSHLYRLTPFAVAERALFGGPPTSFFFVDLWVLSNLGISVLAWLLMSPMIAGVWQWLFILYGAWRVFDVCVYNLRVLLGAHSKIPDPNTVRSTRRSLLLGLLNYIEVLFWFAAVYRFISASFGQNADLVSTATGSFYFSILTMATYGDITPTTIATRWLVAIHLAIALFLTLIVLARFVSLLPRPKSLDETER